MANLYFFQAAAAPTTSATSLVGVASGSVVKTILQVAPNGSPVKIIEWGVSFNGSTAGIPGTVELLNSGTVAATVTAHASGDIGKFESNAILNPANPFTSLFTSGTAGCGYNASAEGAITAVTLYDLQQIAPTNQYVKQYPLGREPVVNEGTFARIRCAFTAAVSGYAYMIIEA